MTLFRYFLGKPWLYILVGAALFALMLFSFYDVKRGGSIVPMSSLVEQSGELAGVKIATEKRVFTSTGEEKILRHYLLEVKLVDGSSTTWQLLSDAEFEPEMLVAGLVNTKEQNKLYSLEANGTRLLSYKDMQEVAAQKARNANKALTRKSYLVFMGLLFFGGVLGLISERRKKARYQKQIEEQNLKA